VLPNPKSTNGPPEADVLLEPELYLPLPKPDRTAQLKVRNELLAAPCADGPRRNFELCRDFFYGQQFFHGGKRDYAE